MLIIVATSLPQPARGIADELDGDLTVELSFGRDNLTFAGPIAIPLFVNVTNAQRQPVQFTYFGAWHVESYDGLEFGGQIARVEPAGNTTADIDLSNFYPAVGLLVVVLAAYSGPGFGVAEASLVVYRSGFSLGSFLLELTAGQGSVGAGSGVSVTSHSTTLLTLEAIENVWVFYFSFGGFILPSPGLSDGDGDDRVMFWAYECPGSTVAVVALGYSEQHGISVGVLFLQITNRRCEPERRPQAAASLEYTVRDNQTTRTARYSVSVDAIEFPPPAGSRNVTLAFIPRLPLGEVSSMAYLGDGRWLVDYQMGETPPPLDVFLFGRLGIEQFASHVLADTFPGAELPLQDAISGLEDRIERLEQEQDQLHDSLSSANSTLTSLNSALAIMLSAIALLVIVVVLEAIGLVYALRKLRSGSQAGGMPPGNI